LLSCQNITKSFGSQRLFKEISLGVNEGESIGLIGPNGSGKTTFLKILAGIEKKDSGEIALKQNTRLVYLPQSDIFPQKTSVENVLLDALGKVDRDETEKYKELHKIIRLSQFPDENQIIETMSGGWKKRLSIACALIQSPDLLLLDEPTNHLDLEGILWLENLLVNASFSFMVVSHDRYFLENVCNITIELNRLYPDGYFRYEGKYSEFIMEKEAFAKNQQSIEASLANKMRRETEWLSRGPKARTTKAKGRIDSANHLWEQLYEIRMRNLSNRKIGIDLNSTDRKTKRLINVENLGKSLGGKTLFNNLSLTLSPGMCLGIMGKNGTGKSTFMSLLEGKLKPDSGKVEYANTLKVAVFDQKREQLDPDMKLKIALAPSGDTVEYRGRLIHVASWAKKFLFKTDDLEMPIRKLSGGEQARILIARLMLKPADILLLDEPTNDLDIPTLEVLEESLLDFTGAIVFVSHDRYLMDKLSTHIMGIDGKGGVEFFADFDQWLKAENDKEKDKKKAEKLIETKKKTKRLSYNEQRELSKIEEKILKAEDEVKSFQEKLLEKSITSNPGLLHEYCDKLKAAQEDVDTLYKRWEELENLKTA
ncbi:MAG: ABC-F family ATP-binding cassette domain-containing protein, partial [Nitrospinae bacterium]|nr:ABC-F family ATP-binding cassette domain-containing protein [Nitrospinota bacterium]